MFHLNVCVIVKLNIELPTIDKVRASFSLYE